MLRSNRCKSRSRTQKRRLKVVAEQATLAVKLEAKLTNIETDVATQVKHRRQIIMVTHNPNIAVVCDAEQIIHASIDRQNGNRITYTSGSIENPVINKHVLDVLEGTRPAFDNREAKYHA